MKAQEWVRLIKKKEFIFIFFDAVLLVLPGAGILFIYRYVDFMALDWIRIGMLGAAFMAPLAIWNTAFLPAAFGFTDPKSELFAELTASIITTSVVVCAVATITYVVGYSGRFFAGSLVAIELIIALVAVAKERTSKKSKVD